jgi:IMP dehydrogenase
MNFEKELFDFDSVLITPVFSNIRSRKDVNVSTDFLGLKLSLPVISSNMDTVASPELCKALAEYGTIGTLHRFWSIEENVKAFVDSISPEGKGICPIVSIGIGDKELERAKALYKVGASRFMLDVAHSANIAAVEMYNVLVKEFPKCYFIVGDFGIGEEIVEFLKRADRKPDAVKCGISIGSQCITRLTTGVGTPALSCLLDCAPVCKENNIALVLDGGIKHLGDCAKALIAGADLIVSGSLFAGTEESAGDLVSNESGKFKTYRGSASHESYVVQDKVASWRAAEGIASLIPYKGSAVKVLDSINGGLRSSLSYTNSFTIAELKVNGKFRFVK